MTRVQMATWQELLRFLYTISRSHLRPVDADAIHGFCRKDIPWEHLYLFAENEGVAGLLYYHLHNLDSLHFLPEFANKKLAENYRAVAQSNRFILSEMADLAERLERVELSVIALQGLRLLSLYGDLGVRQLGDVDLMVRPVDKERLKKLLLEMGYRPDSTVYPDLFRKKELWLDLHTHILNLDRIRARRYLFPEDLSEMWIRAQPFFDHTNTLLRLDPFDNFIALAAHALKHSYSRIIWLADLNESLLNWGNDSEAWRELVDRIRLWQQEKIVLYAIILLDGFFDLKVPYWVKNELGLQNLNLWEKYLLRLKLKGFSSAELCNGLWLCSIAGLWKKLEFIKETIFPRDEIMTQIFSENRSRNRLTYVKRCVMALATLWNNLALALSFSFKKMGGINKKERSR
jgi:hypothetical protein